ncbi:MAG: hypothetical protein AAGC97_18610 [Planctomycetota bacterium]
MHERTMRAFARWLFVLCCAAPTVLTLIAIGVMATPIYEHRRIALLQRALFTRTGMVFQIGSLESVSPTSIVLKDVQLSDPETSHPIATVRVVRYAWDDVELVIRLSQPELHDHALPRLWDLLHDRLLRGGMTTSHAIDLVANDLTIRSSTGSATLRDVAGWMRPTDDSITAVLQCFPAEQPPGGDAVTIEITRDRSGGQPQTIWSLNTGGLRVAVAPFADYEPSLRRLGDDATFQGNLMIRSAKSSVPFPRVSPAWSLDLSGSRFDAINLSTLFDPLPHRLSGVGSVSLDRLRLEPDGIVDVIGTIEGFNGMTSASLLGRLASELQLLVPQLTGSERTPSADIPYDYFGARFELYASQLCIEGVCDRRRGFESLPPNTVMTVAGHPIVQSRDQFVPASKLASVLAPAHSVTLPLSDQTQGLLWILRPPRAAMPGQAATQPRHTEGVDTDARPSARISRLRDSSSQMR